MSLDATVVPLEPVAEPGGTAQRLAYCHLKRRILSGAIGPGERINIAETADALQVSRMPVREALRELDAQGLVVMRPNRGASVIDLTPAEAEEYFEIRAALEGLAVGLAVPHLDEEDIERLTLANEQMDRARPEPAVWLERHRRFHAALWEKCGRPRLIGEITRITDLLKPVAASQYVKSGVDLRRVHEHQGIIRSMHARDAVAAEIEVRRHILAVGRNMVERLTAQRMHRALRA